MKRAMRITGVALCGVSTVLALAATVALFLPPTADPSGAGAHFDRSAQQYNEQMLELRAKGIPVALAKTRSQLRRDDALFALAVGTAGSVGGGLLYAFSRSRRELASAP